ncbi:GNAT family N-acetyltransferase [Glaciihabitans sp. dw_435]|uniref:GNAT family N-acetyltransferase n=1 Tax=Glaciihabitans sp. dw_435 TaxID=2720081 RepID=UPI001BD318FF|nr:GNAT family N-acetyltransferase [Glaciihabitans sp. dw_435]
MKPVVLQTPRLWLDSPVMTDAPAVVAHCQDPLFEKVLTLPWPYTPADAEFFLRKFVPNGWATKREYIWAIRTHEGGPLMGIVSYRTGGSDVGFWLGAEHRGQGYMPEALGAVTRWVFGQGVREILWECVAGNTASATTARKSGFRFTGEGPSTLQFRDGSFPPGWHGALHVDDSVPAFADSSAATWPEYTRPAGGEVGGVEDSGVEVGGSKVGGGGGSTSPRVSVVLFDLDDTLFAHRRAVAIGVTAHREALGGRIAAADAVAELARWHALEELHYHRYLSGELDYLGQRRARSRAFVEPFGITLADDRVADAWFDAYLVEYQRAWTLHDDTLDCLTELSELHPAVRLGIITNGDLHFQQSKLDGVGITAWFEHVITSGELGYAKPDPRIFAHACREFGVRAAQALYVGDRLRTDAIGAANAGLTGVWLDRTADATDDENTAAGASGVRVIHSLRELRAIVAPAS